MREKDLRRKEQQEQSGSMTPGRCMLFGFIYMFIGIVWAVHTYSYTPDSLVSWSFPLFFFILAAIYFFRSLKIRLNEAKKDL